MALPLGSSERLGYPEHPNNSFRMIDESGYPYGVKQIDGKPRVSCMPYLYDVAEGNVSGHTLFRKFGFNGDLDNVEEDMWPVGGTYVWPTAEQQMEVISSSAEDSNDKGAGVPGTGVKSIRIYYLDGNYVERTTDVIMNGATAVATGVSNIYRINRMRVLTCGTGLKAAGNIDVRNLSDTPIYGRIPVGATVLRQLVYTVPLGKTLYITDLTTGVGHASGNRYARFTLRSSYDEQAGTTVAWMVPIAETSIQDGTIHIALNIPQKVIATTDIIMAAISDSANADAICSCAVRGWTE